MAKPTKGNKTKRPPSDERRIKMAHINMLKRSTAIITDSSNVDTNMFSINKLSNNRYRIKGVGAQAYKMSKFNKEVLTSIKDINWTRVATLVPFNNPTNLNYEPKKKPHLDRQSK